jgi:hypothetical protein
MSSSKQRPFALKCLRRVAEFLILAAVIGLILHQLALVAHSFSGRAGFGIGVVHGALMPLALPNLVVGDDVAIYAAQNTGRFYKLGYTAGVNGCGLLFFGCFFWRVSRWRRAADGRGVFAH